MTTDAFTTAARAEAKRRWLADDSLGPDSGPILDLAQDVAEWARDHLARQEPTEAEVRAVMKVCREFYSSPVGVGPQFARAVAAAVHAEAGDAA